MKAPYWVIGEGFKNWAIGSLSLSTLRSLLLPKGNSACAVMMRPPFQDSARDPQEHMFPAGYYEAPLLVLGGVVKNSGRGAVSS